MTTVLVIQSRKNPDALAAEREHYLHSSGGTVGLTFKNSLDESEPWDAPEALLSGVSSVILGGSGELDFDGGRHEEDEARILSKQIVKRLSPLISHVLEHDIPTLGICYGHQIIGEKYQVPVVHDTAQNKVGTHPVSLTEEGRRDPLFSALPSTFMAQYGHKDSLSSIPEGAVVLATGERCNVSALRYGNTLYTMQFHPELTADNARSKLQSTPGYLPEGIEIESLIQDSPEASLIIPRFVQLFLANKRK